MKAGQLDRVITITRETETMNAHREGVKAWAPVATLRARIVTGATDETDTDGGQRAATAITFEARFLAGVTVVDRLDYAGQAFDIRAVAEIGRRQGLTIKAVARAS